MDKPAANMAEAFLAVRQFLWDGTGDYSFALTLDKCSTICGASNLAREAGKITYKQMGSIQILVNTRLGKFASVAYYLLEYAGDVTQASIQDYRHNWLKSLINEFGDYNLPVEEVIPFPNFKKD